MFVNKKASMVRYFQPGRRDIIGALFDLSLIILAHILAKILNWNLLK
jgi:hypothetical protein